MLAHIIVISECLTSVMQLYISFVRLGNLRLEIISGTGHLFYSVLAQHLHKGVHAWGFVVLLKMQNKQSKTVHLRTRLHGSAGRCRKRD